MLRQFTCLALSCCLCMAMYFVWQRTSAHVTLCLACTKPPANIVNGAFLFAFPFFSHWIGIFSQYTCWFSTNIPAYTFTVSDLLSATHFLRKIAGLRPYAIKRECNDVTFLSLKIKRILLSISDMHIRNWPLDFSVLNWHHFWQIFTV